MPHPGHGTHGSLEWAMAKRYGTVGIGPGYRCTVGHETRSTTHRLENRPTYIRRVYIIEQLCVSCSLVCRSFLADYARRRGCGWAAQRQLAATVATVSGCGPLLLLLQRQVRRLLLLLPSRRRHSRSGTTTSPAALLAAQREVLGQWGSVQHDGPGAARRRLST